MASKIDKSKPGWLAQVVALKDIEPAAPKSMGKRRSVTAGTAKRSPALPSGQLPRYVPLTIWADLMFGEYAPHPNTLRRWVFEGRIRPRPKMIGNRYFVDPKAEYFDDGDDLLARTM